MIFDVNGHYPISDVNIIDCRFYSVKEVSILNHAQGLNIENVHVYSGLQNRL